MTRRKQCDTQVTEIGQGSFFPAYYVYPMRPRPKQRPEFIVQGNKRFAMTRRPTRDYERQIRELTAVKHPLSEPFVGDLRVHINFFFPNRTHGDIDNLAKAILDGMQGVAFGNDRQIKALHLEFIYTRQRVGKTEVIIDRWLPTQEEEVAASAPQLYPCYACGEFIPGDSKVCPECGKDPEW